MLSWYVWENIKKKSQVNGTRATFIIVSSLRVYKYPWRSSIRRMVLNIFIENMFAEFI